MSPSPGQARVVSPRVGISAFVLIALLAAGTFLTSRVLATRSAPAPQPSQVAGTMVLEGATAPGTTTPRPAVAPPPGEGILTGRLVDALTGLPVADAGITLQELGRRGLSGPDGRFRFDGVAPASLTVAFGPVDGYVPRFLEARHVAGGTDLGITPLLPVAPPVYVVPEFGGLVPGCRDTRLVFASAVLPAPAAVSVTCVESASHFPAPPPAGRLPLAVVDTAPATLSTLADAALVVELPPQPRYGPGVALELLRLDLDRLAWRSAGEIHVDLGGRTASGPIPTLGTYLVLAPPFGQFPAGTGQGPAVNRFAITGQADGEPRDVFAPGTPIVYASFDYARMDNTSILARTVDANGLVVFESRRPYTQDGRDNVPMVAPDGLAWPVGHYVTSLYIGEPPSSTGGGISWRVAAAPTAVPVPPTVPALPEIAAGPAVPLPAPAAIAGCPPPVGWWARVVVRGDTLSGLALRTGVPVATLMQANCLTGPEIYAGQVLYLPRPPAALQPQVPLPPAKPPVYPTWVVIPVKPEIPTAAPPVPTALPLYPASTPWKPEPPPGGWPPQQPPPAYPTLPAQYPTPPPLPPRPDPIYPIYPTNPPAARGVPTAITKWTPAGQPEPTLAPRPSLAP